METDGQQTSEYRATQSMDNVKLSSLFIISWTLAQEEANEGKGIQEPFEDMDCFQVSLFKGNPCYILIYFVF